MSQETVNKELKRVVEDIKLSENIDQKEISKRLGVGNTYLSKVINGTNPLTMSLAEKIFSEFGIKLQILSTILNNVKENHAESNDIGNNGVKYYIRLLPISAIGGSLNSFVMSIKDSDCEKIISPIKDVDFAISVTGHSMYPEFPAGSQVLIKKIDEKQFIEWGRTYVLDTVNGVVMKKLIKGEPGFYHCVSVNPDQEKYSPFDVPEEAVFGVYRVLMIMSMK